MYWDSFPFQDLKRITLDEKLESEHISIKTGLTGAGSEVTQQQCMLSMKKFAAICTVMPYA